MRERGRERESKRKRERQCFYIYILQLLSFCTQCGTRSCKHHFVCGCTAHRDKINLIMYANTSHHRMSCSLTGRILTSRFKLKPKEKPRYLQLQPKESWFQWCPHTNDSLLIHSRYLSRDYKPTRYHSDINTH